MVLLLPAIWSVTGCQAKKPLSPEAQALVDRYHRIKDGMHERDVDLVFAGNPSRTERRAMNTTRMAAPLKGRSTYQKFYDQRPGATEGHCFVCVYFDEAGSVVGKDGGEYCW